MHVRALLLLALFAVACSDEPAPDPSACTPGDCSALGLNCGQHRATDGTCTICGRCSLPQTCGGGGVLNVCGCTPPVCAADQCGQLADDCGGAPVACPATCSGLDTCGGAGDANRCGHVAAHGAACSATAICGEGDACCSGTCVLAGPGGACPQAGPDMTVEPALLSTTMVIENRTAAPTDCAIADACLPGPGTFKVLRFATQTTNVGTADLVIGDPRTVPDAFMFAQCHGHQHYIGYTEYRLVDRSGRRVSRGFKAGFCIEDTARTSSAAPLNRKYNCDPEVSGVQGIQAGWSDVYLASLDCQWVDITNVPAGDYFLEVEVNPAPRRFHEASYDNNVARVPVTIP